MPQSGCFGSSEALPTVPCAEQLAGLTCHILMLRLRLQMDLGLGSPAVVDRELTHPLARGMVVIRGAQQVGWAEQPFSLWFQSACPEGCWAAGELDGDGTGRPAGIWSGGLSCNLPLHAHLRLHPLTYPPALPPTR